MQQVSFIMPKSNISGCAYSVLSFTSRSVASFTTGNSNGTGQVSSFCQIKSGPLNHKFAWSSLFGIKPLDARSAGLLLVFTYRHLLGLAYSWMMLSRFATKVWNLEEVLQIYFKTVVKSVHITMRLIWYWSSCKIQCRSFAATTAAVSSSLGIVIRFNGAILDLPKTKAQWIDPSARINL